MTLKTILLTQYKAVKAIYGHDDKRKKLDGHQFDFENWQFHYSPSRALVEA
jgi:carbonic anhydrase